MDKFVPMIEQVHADDRGEIFVINLPDDRELVLLHSVEGSMRGGHAHDVDEVVVLLSGEMSYYKKAHTSARETMETLHAGDSSFNEAGLIHMGVFLEDSWIIEQKLAKKGEWRNIEHKPWREKVTANTAGR